MNRRGFLAGAVGAAVAPVVPAASEESRVRPFVIKNVIWDMNSGELASYKKLIAEELSMVTKLAESPTRKVFLLAVSCHKNMVDKVIWSAATSMSDGLTKNQVRAILMALEQTKEKLEKALET